ncbi:hypothetical protein HK096_002430 [Nowakowskiella sp. JEL0078]|nr:hypothetical protein HK096_002430 [Nowakowskiella sp. JEL0078]
MPQTETTPLLPSGSQAVEADDPSVAAQKFGEEIAEDLVPFAPKKSILNTLVQKTSSSFYDAFNFQRSIWPSALGPAIVTTIWSALVVTSLPSSIYFITIIGVAYIRILDEQTLLTNGRRLWSQLQIQIVNFGRVVWFGVHAPGSKTLEPQETSAKRGALSLLVGLATAIKYHLRDQHGTGYRDLRPYLEFIPEFSPGRIIHSSLPIEIVLHLSAYINDVKARELLDATSYGTLNTLCSSFIETLTLICRTPIPKAYHVFIKQTLIIYICSIPFQMTPVLHWFTIPVVFFAGGTLLGMEALAREIENPFGTDLNDLPIDDYVEDIRKELVSIMKVKKIEVKNWGVPASLELEHSTIYERTVEIQIVH